MTERYDVVIAGGGHNALACGCILADAGLSVLIAERNPWIGGGSITREVTLPDYKHDMYGSSHVWIHANEAFNRLKPELERYGLKYIWADDHITGHPNHVGDGIIVYKDIDKTCRSIAQYSEKDAHRYREIYDGFAEIREGFVTAMFSPPAPPGDRELVMRDNPAGIKMLREYRLSPKAYVRENFENPHVQAFVLGWAMAPQLWPHQENGGQTFNIMIPAIHHYGESIPQGGTKMLPIAMQRFIEERRGKVLTEATIERFMVQDGACTGIRLTDGREFLGERATVTSLDPHQSFLRLVEPGILSEDFLQMARNFSFGKVSIVRIHCALNEPPQFKNGIEMSLTPFQRIFGDLDDIEQQYAEIALGCAPTNPFLWSACWTLKDPSRAPAGKHTLIVDTFVPNKLKDGRKWEDIAEDYAHSVLLEKLREYTTNMGDENILAYYVDHAASLANDNWSLVAGTTTGGERTMAQTGYFRPFPGYSQYRSPIKNLYMTGPSCHPGGGISAMGTITADVMLGDFGMKEAVDEFDY